MVIKYRLGFDDASDDYAYLASQILRDKNANVIKTDNEIIIYIDGNEEEIKSAFALLGEELPLSLYLSEQNVEEAAMMPPNRQPLKEVSYLAMHPYAARDLIDDRSDKYFDISGVKLVIDGKEVIGKDAVKDAVFAVASKLKEGMSVSIKNERNNYVLSTLKSPAFVLTNLTERNLLNFGVSMDEALSLSAMERPFVLALEEDGFKMSLFANDAVMLLLSKAATDSGIDALYLQKAGSADMSVEYRGAIGDAPERKVLYFCGSDRFFVNDEFVAQKIEAGGSSLFFDMNVRDSFGVYALKGGVGSKKIVSSEFFAADIWGELKSEFDFGAKLSENFKSKFQDRFDAVGRIDMNSKSAIEAFFEATSALLGLKCGFEYVVFASNTANIEGGVKLDFVLTKDANGAVSLNLKKCLTSMLSYKIAGVEDGVLAYSFFESAIDFLIVSQDEVKKSFEINKLYVGGEFLLSKVFVSKLKAKIKNIDIDMALNSLPSNLQGLYEIAR